MTINILAFLLFLFPIYKYDGQKNDTTMQAITISCSKKPINYHRRGPIGEIDLIQIKWRTLKFKVLVKDDLIYDSADSVIASRLQLVFIDIKGEEVRRKSFWHGNKRAKKKYSDHPAKMNRNCTYFPNVKKNGKGRMTVKFRIKIFCKNEFNDALIGYNLRSGKYEMFLKLKLKLKDGTEIESNKLPLIIKKG